MNEGRVRLRLIFCRLLYFDKQALPDANGYEKLGIAYSWAANSSRLEKLRTD